MTSLPDSFCGNKFADFDRRTNCSLGDSNTYNALTNRPNIYPNGDFTEHFVSGTSATEFPTWNGRLGPAGSPVRREDAGGPAHFADAVLSFHSAASCCAWASWVTVISSASSSRASRALS